MLIKQEYKMQSKIKLETVLAAVTTNSPFMGGITGNMPLNDPIR